MRWFKHDAEFLSSSDNQIILDKHGTRGTDALIRLMEYAAKHFDVDKNPGVYVESQRQFFSTIFPTSCRKTSKKILKTFQNFDIGEFEFRGKEIIFTVKKIIELADEYTLKILKKREGNER
jgi:hypothetical protein